MSNAMNQTYAEARSTQQRIRDEGFPNHLQAGVNHAGPMPTRLSESIADRVDNAYGEITKIEDNLDRLYGSLPPDPCGSVGPAVDGTFPRVNDAMETLVSRLRVIAGRLASV